MYDNIGGKIKGLAKATFIVGAIAAVITGIALMASDEDMIPVGLLVMVVGPIVAWVSSWLLYGFGELIENSAIAVGKETIKPNSSNTTDFSSRIKKCELCNAEVEETIHCKIQTEHGVIYRHICKNCFENNEATPT